MQTTIDRAGRVVIPKPLRERAGLTPGARLDVEFRDGHIEIEPFREPTELVRKGSVLVARRSEGAELTSEQVASTLREVREQR